MTLSGWLRTEFFPPVSSFKHGFFLFSRISRLEFAMCWLSKCSFHIHMSHMYLYLDGQPLHQLTGKYHSFSVLFAQLVQDLFHFRSFHCISQCFTIRICWFSWKTTDIKHWQSWKIAAHFNFGQLFWNTYGWTSFDLNMKQPMDHVPTFPSCSPISDHLSHPKWAFSRCVVARATRTIKIWQERIKWQ